MMGALVVDKKEKFLEQFRIAKGLSGMSKAAELALEKLSFPSTRDEYWKYTRLAKVQNSEFSVKEFNSNAEVHSINERALHIECINGFFQTPVGEIQTGIEITPIEDIDHALVDYQTDFFSALNTAYYTSGIRIKIKAGTKRIKNEKYFDDICIFLDHV